MRVVTSVSIALALVGCEAEGGLLVPGAGRDTGASGSLDAAVTDATPPDVVSDLTCDVNNGGCAPEAICTQDEAGIECTCPTDLVGDGLTCLTPALDGLEVMLKPPVASDDNRLFPGMAVSADGRAVVTADVFESPFAEAWSAGAAFAYERARSEWAVAGTLRAEVSRPGARFGEALAMNEAGSRLVVSEPGFSRILTFLNADGVWRSDGEPLYASRPSPGFGGRMAMSGDGSVLAVRTWETVRGFVSAGSVHIFHRRPGAWLFAEIVTAPNPGTLDHFGRSLALDRTGRRLFVGAWGEDSGTSGVGALRDAGRPAVDSGAVYVFHDSGSGYELETFIKAEERQFDAEFGSYLSVSDAGDVLAVGVPLEDRDGLNRGAVYLYRRDVDGWRFEARRDGTDRQGSFGSAVDLSPDGTFLAVGATRETTRVEAPRSIDAGPAEARGAVHVFRAFEGDWRLDTHVTNPGPDDAPRFGSSVFVAEGGSPLVVGASDEKSSGVGVVLPDDFDTLTLDPAPTGAIYVFR